MKKIFLFVSVVILTFSLVGCSWNNNENKEPVEPSTPIVDSNRDDTNEPTYIEARKYLYDQEAEINPNELPDDARSELLVFGYNAKGELISYSRSEIFASEEAAKKAYEKLENKEGNVQIDLQIVYNEEVSEEMKSKTKEQLIEDLKNDGYMFDI